MTTPRTVFPIFALVTLLAAAAQAAPQKKDVVAPEEAHGTAPAAAPAAAAPVAAAAPGLPAPDFALPDTEGRTHRLADYLGQGKTVVLEWFNPDCPFVKKHHEKNKTMATMAAAYAGKDVVWLAVNSGAPGKQGHGLDRNRRARRDYGIAYPVLLDEEGAVGRAYGAKTSPHMFVIADGKVAYAGAIDDNATPGALGQVNYVAKALDAVLAGSPVDPAQTKPYGCSVKYGAAVP
jgi:peroxiredoxin